MTYELFADWIIYNDKDYRKISTHRDRCWQCKRGPREVSENTAYCMNSGIVSRFKNGRFRVIKGKMFLDTLQETLDTFNPSILSKYGNDIYLKSGGIACCENGFLYLT